MRLLKGSTPLAFEAKMLANCGVQRKRTSCLFKYHRFLEDHLFHLINPISRGDLFVTTRDFEVTVTVSWKDAEGVKKTKILNENDSTDLLNIERPQLCGYLKGSE